MIEYLGQIDQSITYQVLSEGLISIVSTIEAGTSSVNISFNITSSINDDIFLEPDEVYNVSLLLIEPNPQVVITNPVTTVTIMDDDRKLHECVQLRDMKSSILCADPVTIGFDDTTIRVPENIGRVNIPVSLVEQVTVPVTVDFQIMNGSAMEGFEEGQYIGYELTLN